MRQPLCITESGDIVISYFEKERYLAQTPLLDFSSREIQRLISRQGWRSLNDYQKIRSIYNYVRDCISFGYNESDRIAASKVLREGYGQCNTKTVLFMALLRAVGIPCRIHGFLIDKKLQEGIMTGWLYRNAPDTIVHTWTEVLYDGRWYELEGLILDRRYLEGLQRTFSNCTGSFCGYGAAVSDFRNPQIEWNKNHTYIQKEGIIQDLGTYDTPDELLNRHRQSMGRGKSAAYRLLGRHLMNRNVERMRRKSRS